MGVMTPVTAELLRRYDRPGPRYTSYPTAVEFAEDVGAEAYAAHLARAAEARDEPLNLYVHLPFCDERCLFCGCTVVISPERTPLRRYLDCLVREVRGVAARLGGRRRVTQYHWGGGTPTYLAPTEMRELQAAVAAEFDIDPKGEIAVEVDPRVTTPEHLATLRELGFNRLSLGVQDFAADVQQAVNRIQSFETTRDLVAEARRLGFQSTNVDLIYGLPLQQPATFRETLEQVLAIRPERVAVYSFAHVPWLKGHQRKIPEETLPPPPLKLELFASAIRAFTDAGYRSVGMDHFALPEDEMGRAIADGTLWRNFMGYTVRHAPDMIGLGMSAIGDVRGAFFQNRKRLVEYEREVEEGRLATERGYVLDRDDLVRRHVITALMCTFRVDAADVGRRFGIDFWETFAAERGRLDALARDGFVKVSDKGVEVVGQGRLFVRNVCMEFDAHLARPGAPEKRFSRTV
jgi:oxygen-independent coproporphyrinogen-3 oxidase